jgi:hypothetical protein
MKGIFLRLNKKQKETILPGKNFKVKNSSDKGELPGNLKEGHLNNLSSKGRRENRYLVNYLKSNHILSKMSPNQPNFPWNSV